MKVAIIYLISVAFLSAIFLCADLYANWSDAMKEFASILWLLICIIGLVPTLIFVTEKYLKK